MYSQTLIAKDLDGKYEDITGKPYVVLEGEQNKELEEELSISKIHVSLSHEEEYAVAYALAETDKWVILNNYGMVIR